nr:hypothetical protein [Clostridiales bacterium]
MKKYISLSKALAVFITICMVVTAMPIFASAAATMRYIDLDETDPNNPVYSFSSTAGNDTVGVYITGSSEDTYVLEEDISNYALLINEVEVVIGENGDVDTSNILTSGYGHISAGPMAFSTEGLDACPYTDAPSIAQYYMQSNTIYVYSILDDMYIDSSFEGQQLVVANGTLTIATIARFDAVYVLPGASIYIEAPASGDPNGLNINYGGSLSVETGGSITADDGQILEIGTDASAGGIDFYSYDGQTVSSYTIDAQHDPLDFEYYDSKWVLPDNGQPGPGSDCFMVQAREVYDNGGGYIGVTRSSDLQSGERSINPGFMESYTPGETLSFRVSPPQSEQNVAVKYTIMDQSGSSYQTYSVAYDSQRDGYFFDVTAPQSGLLEIYVTWSQ